MFLCYYTAVSLASYNCIYKAALERRKDSYISFKGCRKFTKENNEVKKGRVLNRLVKWKLCPMPSFAGSKSVRNLYFYYTVMERFCHHIVILLTFQLTA